MGILFRKVKSVGPFRFTFSKSGMSTRIGTRGIGVSFGKRGTYLNAGIPGSGFYSRTKISSEGKNESSDSYHSNIDNDSKTSQEELKIRIYESKLSRLSTGIWSALILLGCFLLFVSVVATATSDNDSEIFNYETLPSIGLIILGVLMINIRRRQWTNKIEYYQNEINEIEAEKEENKRSINDVLSEVRMRRLEELKKIWSLDDDNETT
jgi:hypothetical protein